MVNRRTLLAGAISSTFSWPGIAQVPRSTIRLTIDDGWCAQEAMLDSLIRHRAHATYFVTGETLRRYSENWGTALEAGMSLGCHSERHRPASRLTESAFRRDLRLFEQSAKDSLGAAWRDHVQWYRFPFGDAGGARAPLFAHILQEEYGWKAIAWDIDLSFEHPQAGHIRPFRGTTSPLAVFEVQRMAEKIVLLHFTRQDALTLESLLEHYSERHVFKGLPGVVGDRSPLELKVAPSLSLPQGF